MDDTKLLEDAARSLDRTIKAWNHQRGVAVAVLDDDTFWQPLLENNITDCMGDALRLAVKLRMQIDILDRSVRCLASGGTVYEDGTPDCAATRRAIVRAAAAIGGFKK
jgi:hypothetical protein